VWAQVEIGAHEKAGCPPWSNRQSDHEVVDCLPNRGKSSWDFRVLHQDPRGVIDKS